MAYNMSNDACIFQKDVGTVCYKNISDFLADNSLLEYILTRGHLFKAGLALTLGKNLTRCFIFVYFCTSVYLKTSEKKTPIDPDKISEEIFPSL